MASVSAAPEVMDALVGDHHDPRPWLIVDVHEDPHRINQPSEGTESDPNLVHFVKNNIYIRDRSRSPGRAFSQQHQTSSSVSIAASPQ